MICTSPVEPVTLTNPTIISEFSQAALQAALDNNGQITFDTTTPITITISSQLNLSTVHDTVLDGKGLVTLDGQKLTRIFKKDLKITPPPTSAPWITREGPFLSPKEMPLGCI